MKTIDINKEFFRIAGLAGLKLIDDVEHIQSKTLWLEDLQELKYTGTKDYRKDIFFIMLNLYEVDTKKAEFYESIEELQNVLEKNLFELDTEHEIKLEIKEQSTRKISTDIAKFYQHSIDLMLYII